MRSPTFVFMLIGCLSTLSFPVIGQADTALHTPPTNFFDWQAAMNEKMDATPRPKTYKKWKRKEWFLEPRFYPEGKMFNLTMANLKAYRELQKTLPDDRSTHGAWTFIGPNETAVGLGRLNAIAHHPTNPNLLYVGGSNGGIWKSSTGGTSWTNISPDLPLLSVADIQLSPEDPDVIYVLTGDGNPGMPHGAGFDPGETSSIGILISPDAGQTWQPSGLSFDTVLQLTPIKLLIHPSDVDIQFVASEQGLLRTENHWSTHTEVIPDHVYDIEYKPGSTGILYASGEDKIWKSTDGGELWNEITDPDFTILGESERIELAVAPSSVNVVYALAGHSEEGLKAVLQSESSGNNNTWTFQNVTYQGLGAQATYNNVLAVDPNDFTDVFAGFQHMSKSSNEGIGWTNIGSDIHVDHHELVFAHGALWACTDGGLYKSTNEGADWTNLTTGLAITEMYRISGTPNNPNLYLCGTQDNGTMRRTNGPAFDNTQGGDGMDNMIDYTTSFIQYCSSQNGHFYKSITMGAPGTWTELDISDTEGPWVSPCIMDETDPDRLFFGLNRVFLTTDGGISFEALPWSFYADEYNCLAQGVSNPNRLYASNEGSFLRADNALAGSDASWIPLNNFIKWVTGIAVDPSNSSRVFISFSGFDEDLKVMQSNNAGEDWINITDNLPNTPINCIAFHENGLNNNALYIGTDIGIFYRDDALGEWIYYSNSLPTVPVIDLYINESSNTITAGTYGRGMWRSNLYDGCLSSISLTHVNGNPVGGVRYYSATNTITSNAIYKKEPGTDIHYIAASAITLTTDFNAGKHGYFHGSIGECPGEAEQPLTSPYVSTSKLIDKPYVRTAQTKPD